MIIKLNDLQKLLNFRRDRLGFGGGGITLDDLTFTVD